MTDRRRSLLPWGSRGLAVASLVWVVFASAELALFWNAASYRVHRAFPLLDRVILVGWELVALAPLSLLLGLSLHRLSGTGAGEGDGRGSGAGLAAGSLLGALAGLLFGASWLASLATGEFLNGTGVRLWLADPVRIVRHAPDMMPATLLATLPVFAVLGALILGYGAPRVADRLSDPARRSLNRKLALVNAILLVLGALGEVRIISGSLWISDPEAGRVHFVYDQYQPVRAERTGPAARAVTMVWGVEEAAIDWFRTGGEVPFFMSMNLLSSNAHHQTPEGLPRRFGPDSIDFDLRFAVLPPEKVLDRREALERRLGSWIEAQVTCYGTLSMYEPWCPPKLVPAGGVAEGGGASRRREEMPGRDPPAPD